MSAWASVSKSFMFRWMPATRRIRLRWFSVSLDALSQTSRAVSAASIDASASRPIAATATTPILHEGGGIGGFGFRFHQTPARFGKARLEVARSRPGARDLLHTPLEPFGHPDAIETLDFTQSCLAAEGAQP